MPGVMKTPHTEKVVQVSLRWPGKGAEMFAVSGHQANVILALIRDMSVKTAKEAESGRENLSWRTAAQKELLGGSAAAYLRGLRLREGLSQVALAEAIGMGVLQNHISEMEHGKRAIGKTMAKRLAVILRAPDYRLFL